MSGWMIQMDPKAVFKLRRFRRMAEAYGSNVQRWPDRDRSAAARLLAGSAEARRVIEREADIDAFIENGGACMDAVLWKLGEQEVALVRLRAGTAARIGGLQQAHAFARVARTSEADIPFGMTVVLPTQRIVIALLAIAVVGGLSVGWLRAAAQQQAGEPSTLFEAVPIGGLGW